MPRAYLIVCWTCSPSPKALATSTPQKAAGTDPAHSQPTSRRLTVPRRMWTAPPTGFMMAEATRSLETAARGGTLKSNIIIGVISAPPPMPVRPMMIATRNDPTARGMSMPIGLQCSSFA